MDIKTLEEQILEFWDNQHIFEKSVANRSEASQFTFYDGPPFATGLPHYGHILASTIKDVVPRYWTMKGYRVERRWGWDCHGLPIENIIEKELKLPNKQAIDDFGIANFNQACRNTVQRFAADWKQVIHRLGRWVDMDNDYKTMEPWYMESLWWVFKSLFDQGLIYQGHKSMYICPRCVTPLANFEVTQGYKEVKDISVIAQFKIKNSADQILAWTTTPWTLPGNVLLALNPTAKYVRVKGNQTDASYIMAKDRLEFVFGTDPYTIQAELEAKDLEGLEYEPLFPYFKDTPHAFRTVLADFVTLAEGTGIVHIAPAFGEDDYFVGKRESVPLVQHVTMEGKFIPAVTDFAGLEVKPKDNPLSADIQILKYLESHDSLFRKINITHTYPHCWRCDSPLINYATDSWFVDVTRIKDKLLSNNQKVNWVPDHIKTGRFGKWLANARDWAISRNRYWGTPLPIWRSDDGDTLCIGSIQELAELSGIKATDLHKEFVDKIVINRNGKVYHRIPEVLDCWFESGAMPYASVHYPFENKAKFEARFPANFISEGQDQTRGWFYTLHVLATALTYGETSAIKCESTSAFQNVVCSGIVLAEDGKKMSKRLNNYPDPMLIADKYGVDALRLYLLSSPVVRAENLNFSEKGVDEVRRKVINITLNILSFYTLYRDNPAQDVPADHVLDRWLISRLESVTQTVTDRLDAYDLVAAVRSIMDFVDEFSTWWLRSSRERIRTHQGNVMVVFNQALERLSLLLAPFAPFTAEYLYQTIRHNPDVSVHLVDWVPADTEKIDPVLEAQMLDIRKAAEKIHAERKAACIPTRQPLANASVTSSIVPAAELLIVLAAEVNLKQIHWQIGDLFTTKLDTKLTPELRAEGEARELIRQIQDIRKALGTGINDQIEVIAPSWPAQYEAEIREKVKAISLTKGEILSIKPCSKA